VTERRAARQLPPPAGGAHDVGKQRRRRGVSDDAERERRARRAADTRRCRARQRAHKAIYTLEADEQTFDLAVRFAGLDPDTVSDKQAVTDALAKLLRLALAALLRERAGRG
jgi:hypothetical protein